MEIFYTIIKNIIKIDDYKFFSIHKDDGIHKSIKIIYSFYNTKNIFFYNTKEDINCETSYMNKFTFFKNAYNHFLIKYYLQDEFLNYFCKIQRTYYALNRFAFNYKYKKAKMIVNTDMLLNEINENEQNVICIYHKNAKYLFKIYDILKIINNSLIHAHNFFADPKCIKNPYNNVPFTKNILYYIHYFIIEKTKVASNIQYTDLFFKFHSCHFNLTQFLNKYEYLLREKCLSNYIKNSTNEILYMEIMNMINIFNINKTMKHQILINKDFPKNKLIEIFRPYLILFVNSRYLLVSTLKKNALYDLEKRLKDFQKFNPAFSRSKILFKNKLCKDGKIRKIKYKEDYNDKHLPFHKESNEHFLKDHLTYKFINFYQYMDDTQERNNDFLYNYQFINYQPMNFNTQDVETYENEETDEEDTQEENNYQEIESDNETNNESDNENNNESDNETNNESDNNNDE